MTDWRAQVNEYLRSDGILCERLSRLTDAERLFITVYAELGSMQKTQRFLSMSQHYSYKVLNDIRKKLIK